MQSVCVCTVVKKELSHLFGMSESACCFEMSLCHLQVLALALFPQLADHDQPS